MLIPDARTRQESERAQVNTASHGLELPATDNESKFTRRQFECKRVAIVRLMSCRKVDEGRSRRSRVS